VIRLVIANQKGGVAKTTTTLSLAREFAERGLRVLLIDIDPQGSIGATLGLKAANYLYSFVISNYRFKDCLVAAHPNVDVNAAIGGDRHRHPHAPHRPGADLSVLSPPSRRTTTW
jgi:cellulose biosynthesis protein BcsQ